MYNPTPWVGRLCLARFVSHENNNYHHAIYVLDYNLIHGFRVIYARR